jgi:cytochrome c biogenesis protein ResB
MAVPIGYELNVDELGASVEADDGSVPRLRLRSGSGIETYLIRQHRLRKTDDRYQFVMIHAIPTLVVTLEVVREPGQWLIIAGLALLTLGTCVTLYLSHRRIWFIVNPLAEGRADVVFGGGASRNREGFAREFESIRSTLDELA